MNVLKIQQDLLKDVVATKGGNWFIQSNDSEVILFNKYLVYIFDPEDWLLNTDKLIANDVKTTTTADTILKGADDAKHAVKTGNLKSHDNATLVELKIKDSEELVYLDQKLLKYYDKSAEFEAINHKSPVYVYEDDILVGLVLPVRLN